MLRDVRVLIVNDDPDQAVLYEYAFARVGATTRTADSVEAARAVLTSERFDVVVADVMLPGESGYDLVRWLRTTAGPNRAIIALALTGLDAELARDAALEAGFDEHCVKPCPLECLFGVVERLLGGGGASS